MQELHISFQNVIDGHGIGLTITGMIIVYVSLTIIAVSIALLPHLLRVINKFFPEPVEPVKIAKRPAPAADDEALAAAAAFAFHNH